MLDIRAAADIIVELVTEIFAEEGIQEEVSPDMSLFGGESSLDSLKLVELCFSAALNSLKKRVTSGRKSG